MTKKSDFWPGKWGVNLYTSKYGNIEVIVEGACNMSLSRVELLRVDTTRHLEKPSQLCQQSET